jgi:copper(I)-binding protein
MTIRGRNIAGLAVAAALVACRPPQTASGEIEVRDAWARATASGQETGGAFLSIRNGSDSPDRLVGGSTPAASAVEIHSMRMEGSIMRMRRQDGLDIPAGELVKLGPGGTHLMLVGLKTPLATGDTIPLTLNFAKAGRKQAEVPVRPIGATGPRDAADE